MLKIDDLVIVKDTPMTRTSCIRKHIGEIGKVKLIGLIGCRVSFGSASVIFHYDEIELVFTT